MNDDRPIQRGSEDLLHRRAFADAVADELPRASLSGGRVIAILGPWGAGKSSVLNLIRERLAEIAPDLIALDVNPWLFSGTEQLVELFMRSLADQLRTRRDQWADAVANKLTTYADTLDPLAGVPGAGGVRGVTNFLAKVARQRQRMRATSLEVRRREIADTLTASGRRLVVIVDDIDRLEDDEIRDLVRTVRLVGDFPNVTYLLAFDRARVERALGRGDLALGRDYLEKIVQAAHDLPPIQSSDLSAILAASIDASLTDVEVGPFEAGIWQNVASTGLRGLIRNIRDVHRYSNALRATARMLGPEVALHDVLALEAIRVFAPNVWAELDEGSAALTTLSASPPGNHQQDVDRLLDLAGPDKPAITELLRRLFPAAERYLGGSTYDPSFAATWRRDKRVAHADVLAIYLSRTRPADIVPAAVVESAAASLSDYPRISSLVGALSPDELEQVASRLEAWEEDFPAEPLPAILALLENWHRLRPGRAGMFDFGAELAVDRLVLRLLRRVTSEPARREIVESVLVSDMSLSAKLALVRLVGHEKDVGHRLIPQADSAAFEAALRNQVLNAPSERLAGERDLAKLLRWAQMTGEAGVSQRFAAALRDDVVLVNLLRSALTEGYSQTIGEAHQRRTATLPWEWLETLVGPDLSNRVAGLDERAPDFADPRAVEAVEVASKYAAGWRPDKED